MKTDRSQFNSIYIFIDLLSILISFFIAWFLIIHLRTVDNIGAISNSIYFASLFIYIILILFLYAFFNLYNSSRTTSKLEEFSNILKANLFALLIIMAVLFLGAKNIYIVNYSRSLVVCFIILNILITTLFRNLVRVSIGKVRSNGFNQKHIILIGYSDAAFKFIDRSLRNKNWGYHIFGMIDDNQKIGSSYRNIEVIGNISNLNDIISNNTFDEAVITLSLKEYDKLSKIVSICEKTGIHTKFVPDYGTIIPTKPTTDDLDGLPVINIRAVPLQKLSKRFLKRFFDIVGGLFGIIVFSPIMLIISLIILCCRDGSIIFKQDRVGLHGKLFTMYKFRSMREQTVEDEKSGWTTPDDPRVTKIGKFIRRTSLDEIPQFFNVVKGDMSLIGPRPERKQYVEKFKETIPRYMVKHQVRPGMTGYAQVNGFRGDTPIDSRVKYDLYYIENWSLGLDIKILFQTFFVIFTDKNAY